MSTPTPGIVERLERRCSNGHSGTKPINPDGPEAAALLKEMAEALELARPLIRVGGTTFQQMSDARTAIDQALSTYHGDRT